MGCRTSAVIVLVLQCSMVHAAAAQQEAPPDRERQLEELVNGLTARIADLESRLAAQEQAAGAADQVEAMQRTIDFLQLRIESLENAMETSGIEPQDFRDAHSAVEARLLLLEELQEARKAHELQVFWRDGLRFETADGDFKFKLGGRIQADGATFEAQNGIEQDVGENLDGGVEFRRARLYLSGQIYQRMVFKFQYDFADGDGDFKDVYVGLLDVPVLGDVLVGHFKEPFGLEQQNSSNYIPLMERSTATETFSPERNTGVAFHNRALDNRVTWAFGTFVDSDDFGEGTFDDGLHFTGRMTALPWYEQDGRYLLHLGVAYSHRNHKRAAVRFRTRPESHLAPRFLDTGDFIAESCDLLGLEGAVVLGPLSVQGEYMHMTVDGVDTGGFGTDPQFNGFYVQASYVLTGEHRRYDKRRGAIRGVKPTHDFDLGGEGWGAWEVATRYSNVNLDDGFISADRLDNFTIGVNWYMNPNARVMFNYVLADLEDGGHANVLQWRFQINL